MLITLNQCEIFNFADLCNWSLDGQCVVKVKLKVKERIVLSEIHLRTTGRHLSMGSHSVICHRQRTYRLEQSATSTTFAGSVAEHLQVGTEDASLLIRPATLSRFETLSLLINLPTYLLTYLLT